MGKGGDHMVISVLSAQYSVFRRVASIVKLLRLSVGVLKQIGFFLALLSTEYWTLNTAFPHDLGVHGVIYPIEEQDPIQLIQQKLKIMEDSGELAERNVELQKRTQASVERPKSVEGITKASKGRIFTFDPTYVVNEDLKDHQGQIFAKKGSKINPLETVSLSQSLIFFNGDDEEQLAWVKKKFTENSIRLILTQGAPLKLAEELNIPVYFDQGGVLTKKLGISHVPAVVSQEGLQLRIEEVVLSPSKELSVEGDL